MPTVCLTCEKVRPTQPCTYCGGAAHTVGTIGRGAERLYRYWCVACFEAFSADMERLKAEKRLAQSIPEPNSDDEAPDDMEDLSTDAEDEDHTETHRRT